MTIRVRLTLAYGAAIGLTVGLVGVLVWWQMNSALRTQLDQTLETRAAAVLTSLENDGQAGLQESGAPGPSGVFVAMFDRQGKLVDSSANTPAGFTAPLPRSGSADVALGSSRYATRTVVGSNGSRIVAGASLDGIAATLDRLAGLLALVGGLAIVASLAGGWWLAGRALRPVTLITAEAEQIGAADIGRRVPVPPQRDELRALATTLNGMLDRVAEALRRQRAFVAAASHDLRTPIAALQVELELAEDPRTTEADLRAAIRAARADAVRLGDLAAGLLDLAATDLDGRAVVRTPVRVDVVVASVVRRVEPLAQARDARVTHSAPGRLIRIDRVRLEQALTNLLANAIVHGPEHGEVEIDARFDAPPDAGPQDGAARLIFDVLDRGPGIPAELADRLFEPFQRGPNVSGPGTGLGLATAAAAVRAHHGTIGCEPRPGGGTRFWISLPV